MKAVLNVTLVLMVLLAAVLPTNMSAQEQKDNGSLIVFAAASLTDAFRALAQSFKTIHPETDVKFNFGGSQQLAQQIEHGATADLFASADMMHIGNIVASGLVDSEAVHLFAHNRLTVIVARESRTLVQTLSDLARPHLKIVLADKSVPAGRYALDLLEKCQHSGAYGGSFKEHVLRNVVSYEENVRSVVTKVGLGECDAGIVYVTDKGAPTDQIEIPDSLNITASYPIAILKRASAPKAASNFVKYVLSSAGQKILANYGFLPASFPARVK